MKALITLAIMIFGVSAYADFRSIHLVNGDADFVMHAFRDVSKLRTIAEPITGNPLMDSLSYRSGALMVDCKGRYRLYQQEFRCDLSLNSETVEVTDRDLVNALRKRISQNEFATKARAADNSTPLLRIKCSESVCIFQAAN